MRGEEPPSAPVQIAPPATAQRTPESEQDTAPVQVAPPPVQAKAEEAESSTDDLDRQRLQAAKNIFDAEEIPT
jgi:hypothetical protein